MRNLIAQIWITKDRVSALFLLALVGVAGWIIALPLSSTVQDIALKRFHLTTPHFAAWAVQQPVPAMYNFENRYWMSSVPLREDELKNSELAKVQLDNEYVDPAEFSEIETNLINHFPTRVFTFAQTRSFLKNNPHQYIYMRSRFRDREINTEFRVRPISEEEIRVRQMEVSLD